MSKVKWSWAHAAPSDVLAQGLPPLNRNTNTQCEPSACPAQVQGPQLARTVARAPLCGRETSGNHQHVCTCVLVTQLCPTLCDPMDCSPPSSSVHGIPQAKILEWVAILFSNSLCCTVCLSAHFSSVTQPCLTPCDPMDQITPGFPFHHQLPEFTQIHVH